MDQMSNGDLNWVNGVACIFWSGLLVASIYRQKIGYSKNGWVLRSDSPQLFWLLVAAIGAVAIGTGASFLLHRA